MNLDFTLAAYKKLIKVLIEKKYKCVSFEYYLLNMAKLSEMIICRHDVDKRPDNSLKTAIIENEYGVVGTYYFRIVKKSNNADIIKKIANLGHEIGYHFEDLSYNK